MHKHFKVVAMVLIVTAVICWIFIADAIKGRKVEQIDATIGRYMLGPTNPILYIRDPRTELCFARTGIYARDATLSEVPCTELVLKAIQEDLAR